MRKQLQAKTDQLSSKQIGFAQILLSGLCFGALGVYGKLAIPMNIGFGEFLSLRFSLSAIMIGITLAFSRKDSLKLPMKELIISLLLGVLGYALFSSFYLVSLSGISASLAVLILHTYPVIIFFYSLVILKEKPTPVGVIALFLVMLGTVMLVWGEWNVSRPKFIFFGLTSAVSYALYIIVFQKYLKNTPSLTSSFYVQLGAGLALSLFYFQSPARPIELLQAHPIFILSMSFICSYLAMTLFLAGLRRVTGNEAAILGTAEPVFGVLFAVLFLDERFSILQIFGALITMLGMVFISQKETKRLKVKLPLKRNSQL